VNNLDVALITGGFTIGAVVVTFGGSAFLDSLKTRRAARQARDQAIAELLAASLDLVLAVQTIRVAHQHRTSNRVRLMAAAALLSDLPELKSWKEITDWHVMRSVLATARALAREQDARVVAFDMATTVVARTNRFFAAATALTLEPDTKLADAAPNLSDAGRGAPGGNCGT